MLESLKHLSWCFSKYIIAGGMAFFIDFATLSFLYKVLGVHYIAATAIGFIAGLVSAYITSNKWVFEQRRFVHATCVEFAIFAAVGIVGLGLTVLLMWIFVDGVSLHPLIAKLITTALVLIWNFGARKWILY